MRKALHLRTSRCVLHLFAYLTLGLSYVYGQVPALQSTSQTVTTGHNNLRKLAKMYDAQSKSNSQTVNSNGVSIPRVKDDPQSRAEYEINMLKDPATGLIPEDIRDKELQFAQASNLRTSASARMMASPWQARGPYNVGGRTRALALDLDNENVILAGGVSGGMWRSMDGGATWKKTTGSNDLQSVTAIAQDPRPGFRNIWYYTTGERLGNSASGSGAFFQGNGIYKSTNGGQSWKLLPSTTSNTPQSFDNPFDLIFNIVINPLNGDVYVASYAGIQHSTDEGASFTEVLSGGFDTYTDVAITSTGVLYATLDNRTPADNIKTGIYRSDDGVNWIEITPSGFASNYNRMVLAITPSDENRVWLIGDTPGANALNTSLWKYTYVSGDGSGEGGTWEERSANLPTLGGSVGSFDSQGGYNLLVKTHPTNPDIVFVGGTNLYRSFDGFATQITAANWIGGYSPANNVSIYSNHHPDQHALVFYPSNPNKAISGHDGGLSITTNISATNAGTFPVGWQSLNNGYLTTQPYTVSFDPKGTSDVLIAGFQDNGTWLTTSTTLSNPWREAFSGDGSYNAIVNSDLTRYVSSQNGSVFRLNYATPTSANYSSFTRITPAGASGFLFVNPFILDQNDEKIMYMSVGGRVWRNSNLDGVPLFSNAPASVNWRNLAGSAVVSGSVSALSVSRTPANRLYYGTTTGGIYRIDDAHFGDPTAVNISVGKGLPRGNVSSIAVDPVNADRVFVVFSNYNIRSVFYSENGGGTWIDISGNLEENPDGIGSGPSTRWIAILGNSDKYFVGTSTGLYSTDELKGTQTTWMQENPGGIGNVVVPMVKTRDDGLVAIATHGNGLYSASFDVSPIPAPAFFVENPLADVEVYQNNPHTVLDISNVFGGTRPDSIRVVSTNPNVVKATLTGKLLILEYVKDAVGTADIGLFATSGNQVASDVFTVTVKEVQFVLYQQTGSNSSTLPSQLFTNFGNALAQTADDFTIPDKQSWRINRVKVEGSANGNPVLNLVQVVVYRDNAGKPGEEVYNSGSIAPASAANDPNFDIKLTNTINLPAGKYWLSVYVVLPFVNNTQWFWRKQSVVRGQEAHFRDAEDLFGRGTTEWTKSTAFFNGAPADVTFTFFGDGDIPAPAKPTNLTAAYVSPYRLDLSWTDNSDNEIGFIIERSESLTGTGSLTTMPSGEAGKNETAFSKRAIVGPNDTTYTDTEVFDPKLTYTYRVRSLGVVASSEPSESASTAIIPRAPKAQFATKITLTQFTARWEPVEGAAYYLLDISSNNFQTFEKGYESKKVYGTSLLVTGLTPMWGRQKYMYRVRAVNAGGKSANSNVIPVQPVAPLQLLAVCSEDPTQERQWHVRNPNSFDVPATLQVFGTSHIKKIVATPGDSYFSTKTVRGFNVAILKWSNEQEYQWLTVGVSFGQKCTTATVASNAFKEDTRDAPLSAFPNPSTGKFTIRYQGHGPDSTVLRVYNNKGIQVYTRLYQPSMEAYSSSIDLDLSAFPKGLYFVRISSKNYRASTKILKQ